MRMRIAAAIFVGAHGAGHIIWFMATWARWSLGESGRAEVAKHEGGFIVPALSPMGKLVGGLALVVLAGFFTAAAGIWTQATWWPPLLIGSAVVSLAVAVLMWNPVMNVSVRALLANIGLAAATLMPWGDRILGAH
jgi:hypothetical protein